MDTITDDDDDFVSMGGCSLDAKKKEGQDESQREREREAEGEGELTHKYEQGKKWNQKTRGEEEEEETHGRHFVDSLPTTND